MSKNKINFTVVSYGEYSKWDRSSKELPKIKTFTTSIKAEIDVEFGMILNITRAKSKTIDFCIKHPPFKDRDGKIAPDFTGEYFIDSNNFNFFIGDCIWEPVSDKTGKWTVIVSFEGKEIARKEFNLSL